MWQLFPLMGITSALRTNCRAVISKAARILLDVSKNTARSIDAVSSLNVPRLGTISRSRPCRHRLGAQRGQAPLRQAPLRP